MARQNLYSQEVSKYDRMEVLPGSEKDIPIIQHIASLTWPVAYAGIISPNQVGYMLNKMYHKQTLLSQVKEEGHIFFICYKNNQPIGFAGISKIDYSLKGIRKPNTWKLHKLYVLPGAHKSGGGQLLLNKCFESIIENNGRLLVLNVNRRNPAYNYYLKKGFKVLEEVELDIGAGFLMVDYIMGKEIRMSNE